jgi:hypothetical protein
MDVMLRLAGETAHTDDLRSLRTWLVADDVLRGHVQTVERPPVPGALGPTLDALQIIGDPTAAALAWAVITWLKNQRHDITLTLVRKPDETTVTYSGKRLRHSDDTQIQTEIANLTALLDHARNSDGGQDMT